MPYTLIALGVILASGVALVALYAWASFCFKLADGEIWGLAVMFAPIPLSALAFTLYLDIFA